MFSFTIFILDSSLLSFSSPSRSPCHRTSTTAAPLDLAPAVALQYYIHSLLSSLITGSPSHTTPRALSPARLSLSTIPFPFPQFHLCVAYNVSLRTRTRINTPCVASPKGRQIGPRSPFVFVCVSGQPRPLLSRFVFVCVSSSRSLARPDPAYRHSPQLSANLYVLLNSLSAHLRI